MAAKAKMKRFKVLWPTPINVDSKKRQPGEEFSLDEGVSEGDAGIPALVLNKYIEELK